MKKLLIAFSIGFICILAMNFYFESTEAALASQVIRFHVLANSDSNDDQKLKLKVRDRVINEMNNMFDSNGDIASARCTVIENIDKIKAVAQDEILKNGYNYDVSVSLGNSSFPTKSYGEIVLPAGSYEALKIEIGNAAGQNWWCVLFPPLCFVDESCVAYDSEAASKLTESVGKENAPLLQNEKSPAVKLKFKTYEIWQNGKQKIAYKLGLK